MCNCVCCIFTFIAAFDLQDIGILVFKSFNPAHICQFNCDGALTFLLYDLG